jgi:hypothetical protein
LVLWPLAQLTDLTASGKNLVDAEPDQEAKKEAADNVYDYLHSLLPKGVTVKELMAAKDLPKATAQSYLYQREKRGSVRRDPKAGPRKADIFYSELPVPVVRIERVDSGPGES